MAKSQRGRPEKDVTSFTDMMDYLPILVEVWESDGNVTEARKNLGHEGTKSIYHARTQLRKYVNGNRSKEDPLYDPIFSFNEASGEVLWTEQGIEFVKEGRRIAQAKKRALNKENRRWLLKRHRMSCKTPVYRSAKILLKDFSQITKPKIELVYMCKNCSLHLCILKTLEFIKWRNMHPHLFIGDTPAFLEVKDPDLLHY